MTRVYAHQNQAQITITKLRGLIVGGMLVLLMLFSITGCALFGKSHPPIITFIIYSELDTNDGQPFYIMIRSVNVSDFFTDSYNVVSNMIFASPPNPEVLTARVILPGEKLKLQVGKPRKKPIGIYCIFTNPSDQWKVMLSQPLENKYKVYLEKNSIKKVD